MNNAVPFSQIIFIDASVPEYQALLPGLPANAEVIIIRPETDGMSQIAAGLEGRSGLDAVHIISHGSQGQVQVGSSSLNSNSIANYSSQLATIGGSLKPGGDILLYGCNVAGGDAGTQFIGRLAQSTGADIAASTNVTGAAALGGGLGAGT